MAEKTSPEVMAALRQALAGKGKHPVSPQAVQQRRKRLQQLVPMPLDVATYVIAQRFGVPLHKFLDADVLDQVAAAEQRLAVKESAASSVVPHTGHDARERASTVTVREVHLDKIKIPEAALSPARLAEVERMGATYPILYAFENSVREFIDGHLTASVGKDWWNDSKVVSRDVRNTVECNTVAEGRNRYHSSRKAGPIYYTNIGDLASIAGSEKAWPIFKRLFPSDKWFPALIETIEASRNVVAHMNPLQKRDVDRLKLNFQDWLAQIKGNEPLLKPLHRD
ncbi:MAG: Swt1 family HEPN domain-containing protein [Actinomycetota bacterium]